LLLLVLSIIFFSVSSAYDYRNVTVYEDALLGEFVATAVRIVIVKEGSGYQGIEDALQLGIDNNQIKLLHFVGIESKDLDGTTTDFDEAAFGFYLQFMGLAEYVEVNQLPGYQPFGGDTFISDYLFAGQSWDITKNYTQGLWSITYTTSDGVFSFTFSYAGKPATIDGVSIDENTAKLSFSISYYKSSGASNNTSSQIALLLIAATEVAAARSNHTSSSQSGLTINSGEYSGFLNFENTADSWNADAIYSQAAVHYSYDDSNSDQAGDIVEGYRAGTIILSYLQTRPSLIVHDPEMGASVPTPSSSESSSVFVSVLLLTVSIAFVLIL